MDQGFYSCYHTDQVDVLWYTGYNRFQIESTNYHVDVTCMINM